MNMYLHITFEAWHTATFALFLIIAAFAIFLGLNEYRGTNLEKSTNKFKTNRMKLDIILLKDSIKEIERELSMRQKLYPKWIGQGTLDRSVAERQIKRMTYTLELLRALAADPEAQKAVNDQLKLF